jgi:hypothetical protein
MPKKGSSLPLFQFAQPGFAPIFRAAPAIFFAHRAGQFSGCVDYENAYAAGARLLDNILFRHQHEITH